MFFLTLTLVAWFADLTFFNLQIMSSKLSGFSGKKQFGVSVRLWNFLSRLRFLLHRIVTELVLLKAKNFNIRN